MTNDSLLSGIGIAELHRLLNGESGLSPSDVARLLGYEYKEKANVADARHLDDKKRPDIHDKKNIQKSTDFRPRYWRINRCEEKSQHIRNSLSQLTIGSDDQKVIDSIEELNIDLPPVELKTDAQWWQEARAATWVQSSHTEQMVEHWLKALERGEVPNRSACSVKAYEAGEVWLVLDFHYRLMLWWDDIREAGRTIARRFGNSRVTVKSFENDRVEDLEPYCPSADTRILIFSDLGELGNWSSQQQWRTQLQTWQKQGATITVFSPAPRDSTCSSIAAGLNYQSWEKHQGSNPEIVKKLLGCLSIVQWCSNALLRTWRIQLEGNLADEYTVWHHSHVRHQPNACGLRPPHVVDHRGVFNDLEPELKQQLAASISRRRPYDVKDVLMEEALVRKSLNISGESTAISWFTRLTESVENQEMPKDMAHWLWRLSERQDGMFWEDNPELLRLCTQARVRLAGNPNKVDLGPGMPLVDDDGTEQYHLVLHTTTQPEGLSFSLIDDRLEGGQLNFGVDLINLFASEASMSWRKKVLEKGENTVVKPGAILTASSDKFAQWELENASHLIELEQIERPPWSRSIEQTSKGLYCDLWDGRRLRWCYPGEKKTEPFDPLISGVGMAKAAWVDREQLETFVRSTRLPYLSTIYSSKTIAAIDSGQDEYGQYVDIPVKGVTFGMRWIPPGEFVMGSSEQELGRDNNETQHQVIITQGYWLAETACTQELWMAVMGETPNYMKGSDFPVVAVSWKDARSFCNKLNEILHGLQARLPTEAEWEYACRAATQLKYWWGNEISTKQANYRGSSSGDDEGFRESHDERVTVKSYSPNPYGLYQMNGNIWEWCDDGYESYLERCSIDPLGKKTGDLRVLRGGSWFDEGAWLRSAARDAYDLNSRADGIGFRFASGPLPHDHLDKHSTLGNRKK